MNSQKFTVWILIISFAFLSLGLPLQTGAAAVSLRPPQAAETIADEPYYEEPSVKGRADEATVINEDLVALFAPILLTVIFQVLLFAALVNRNPRISKANIA